MTQRKYLNKRDSSRHPPKRHVSAAVGSFWPCPQTGSKELVHCRACEIRHRKIRKLYPARCFYTFKWPGSQCSRLGVSSRWCTQGFCWSCSGNSKCVSPLRPTSREPSFHVVVEMLWSSNIIQTPFSFSAGFCFGEFSLCFYAFCKCMFEDFWKWEYFEDKNNTCQ